MATHKKEFITVFNTTARERHRYEVFADFVKLSAISLHNAVCPNVALKEKLEQEYLETIGRYKQQDAEAFCKLLALLIELLEVEPSDVLGQLYMELELGNKNTGQFFTPPSVSELMARVLHGDAVEKAKTGFVTLSEPACGAGGMILAFVKVMLEHRLNPATGLWVQAIDIDRTAAFMCYLQLTLWNVPAQVVVGNALTLEVRETFYTPAHYLFNWTDKLNRRDAEKEALKLTCEAAPEQREIEPTFGKVLKETNQMTLFD